MQGYVFKLIPQQRWSHMFSLVSINNVLCMKICFTCGHLGHRTEDCSTKEDTLTNPQQEIQKRQNQKLHNNHEGSFRPWLLVKRKKTRNMSMQNHLTNLCSHTITLTLTAQKFGGRREMKHYHLPVLLIP